MRTLSEKQVEALRKMYLDGTRIECIHMPDDPAPIQPGTTGTCYGVDGIGNLMMKWDNGRSLNLVPGVDKFKVINN